MTWILIFLLLAAIFTVYAWYTHSTTAAPGQPFAARVWAAIVATVIALLASLGAWLQGLGSS